MSYYIRNGRRISVVSSKELDIHESLPTDTYIIQNDLMKGLFLETVDSFKHNKKLYGHTEKNAQKILNTFNDRDSSTGVLLCGEKGSGKTLLAKVISMEAAKLNIPTIVINSTLKGDAFNKFIQDIDQPCVILFDEFEKIYNDDENEQDEILTLLDGTFSSKKLFIFTCNNKYRISPYMLNRPGRIYYMLEFKGLEKDFIVDYCNDNLNAKEHIESVCNLSDLFSNFNFDILQALVEEMNRYNETPQECISFLNATMDDENQAGFAVELYINGKEVEEATKSIHTDPLSYRVTISYKDDSVESEEVIFSPADLSKVNVKEGKYIYEVKEFKLILTKRQNKFDMSKFY